MEPADPPIYVVVCAKLVTSLYVMSRLKMNGAAPSLPHKPFWPAQESRYTSSLDTRLS
jgi:hypothetical protein